MAAWEGTLAAEQRREQAERAREAAGDERDRMLKHVMEKVTMLTLNLYIVQTGE